MVFKIISIVCIAFVSIQLIFLLLILILEKTAGKKEGKKHHPICALTGERCKSDEQGGWCSNCYVPDEYYREREERNRD